MNAETRSEMFSRLLKQIPNPTTELNYSTSFELLVAVTLSAQATDKSVNQVTDILFPLANTPESIFELGEDKLRDTIKSIGLFNSKAKHIIQTCRILIDKYNSEVPETRKELEALPGVGRKTANVVLNTAFGQPTIAVDTHIYRVANRTAIVGCPNAVLRTTFAVFLPRPGRASNSFLVSGTSELYLSMSILQV